MSNYAERTKAPKTMTEDEQRKLLRVSGEHRAGFRDHVIFSIALGTGLREHEIVALNIGDVLNEDGKIRRRFPLRVFKRPSRGEPRTETQEAILPDTLRFKLEKFLRWKTFEEQSVEPAAALFVTVHGRISVRMVRHAFVHWQTKAGLERRFTFHALRHTALTNLYRATKDILLVQKVARHASVTSTMIYARASDEDVLRAMRDMTC